MKRSDNLERLKPNDRATLEGIFGLKQKSLLNTMQNFLQNKYERVVRTKKYLYAIGNIPVALVAHCDTVFPQPPTDIFYDSEKNVMWSPDGLGADDRAGIWAMIKIIRTGLRPHIILTTDEEIGALGASKLVEDCPKPFADMKYLIQLDRRGSNDCVFYDCYNEGFVDYVEAFGFCEAWGSFSDISVICPAWEIAGVNLSIGYQDEHSAVETLWIGHMNKTINKVIKMLRMADNAPKFEYIPNPYTKDWYLKYMGQGCKTSVQYQCGKCKKLFNEYDVFPAKMADGETKWICPDCIAGFAFCERCQEAYELTDNCVSDVLCPDCAEIMFGRGKTGV